MINGKITRVHTQTQARNSTLSHQHLWKSSAPGKNSLLSKNVNAQQTAFSLSFSIWPCKTFAIKSAFHQGFVCFCLWFWELSELVFQRDRIFAAACYPLLCTSGEQPVRGPAGSKGLCVSWLFLKNGWPVRLTFSHTGTCYRLPLIICSVAWIFSHFPSNQRHLIKQ